MAPLYIYDGKLLVRSGKLAVSSNCCCEGGGCDAPSSLSYTLPTGGFCVDLGPESAIADITALPGTSSGWAFDDLVRSDPGDPCEAIDLEDLCWHFNTVNALRVIGTIDRYTGVHDCSGTPSTSDLYALIYGGYDEVRGKLLAMIEWVLNPADPQHQTFIFAGSAAYDGNSASLPVTLNNSLAGGHVSCSGGAVSEYWGMATGGTIQFNA